MIKLTVQGTPEDVTALRVYLRSVDCEIVWESDMNKRSAEATWCSQRLTVKLPPLPDAAKRMLSVAPAEVTVYERRQRGSAKGKTRSTKGHVYLMPGPDESYKIGWSSNIKSRKRTFGVKMPFAVEFIAVIASDDAPALEKELHKRFKDKRMGRSEFFKLSAEDVDYIKSLQNSLGDK